MAIVCFVFLSWDKDLSFQFCGHIWYDSPVLKDMSPDVVYITSMRDPATQAVSAFNFYYPNTNNNISAEDFFSLSWVKAGMKMVQVPSKYLKNKTETDIFIREKLDKIFQLVLIKEYLHESLVLLKRKLCWDLEDILYAPLKVSTEKTQLPNIDPQEIRTRQVSFPVNGWHSWSKQSLPIPATPDTHILFLVLL